MPHHRAFLVAAAAAAVVLAGCTSPSNPNAAPQPAASPTGLAAVIGPEAAALYTSKPYVGGQATPEHVWLEQPDGRVLFYHLNNPDVTKATGLLFVGDAVPGRLCLGEAGVTSAEYDAGYVHFHTKSAASWDAAHNNGGRFDDTAAQGYWLRHIGAKDTTMQMGGHAMSIRKGQVFPLMPADKAALQPCPGEEGRGAQAQTLGQIMAPFYSSQPYTGGQATPEHLWFEQPDGSLLFLHTNAADPLQATGLMFVGDAFPGRFCAGEAGVTQAEYDAGYVHFHRKSAATWDAGHNNAGQFADTAAQGYWLRHVGAMDGTMQMGGHSMDVRKGEVFPLMPAGFDQLQAC